MLINFLGPSKERKKFFFGMVDFSQNHKVHLQRGSVRVCLAFGKVPSNFSLHTNNAGVLLNAN